MLDSVSKFILFICIVISIENAVFCIYIQDWIFMIANLLNAVLSSILIYLLEESRVD